MAKCFCGCGRKVKMIRRPLNGTGTMVSGELRRWDERQDEIGASELSSRLEAFVAIGREILEEVKAITHGGPLRMTRTQKDITEWLNVSSRLITALDAGEEDALADLLGEAGIKEPRRPRVPATADEKESRRAEIEAIRSDYEAAEDDTICPECGAEIADPGEYLAHVSSAHKD